MINSINEFQHLPWDSSFFGFPVAQIIHNGSLQIRSLLLSLRERNYSLVYVFVPAVSIIDDSCLQDFNGILADSKLTFRAQIDSRNAGNKNPKNISVNKFRQVTQELKDLAILAGHCSRFNTDKKIGKHHFRELYTQWIEKSISGEIADCVLTYQHDEKPVAMATLKFCDNLAKIGLISVHPEIQNKGIGKELMEAVFNTCVGRNAMTVEVITQEKNTNACSFYERNGFKKYKTEYVYHFWLK